MAKNLTSFTKRGVERRTLGSRPASRRILIVCGGKETEPNYFKDLRRMRGLTATLVIQGNGKDPIKLVKQATEEIERKGDFDAAYVVFDRDSFANFKAAIKLAEDFRIQSKKRFRLVPIPSAPCFEVWLLLHYLDTGMNFSGSKSPAKRVKSSLAQHFPGYEKNADFLFCKISSPDRLKCAIVRSQQLRKSCADITSCTYTNVDLLVESLQNSN
jgi:RloB-like protein